MPARVSKPFLTIRQARQLLILALVHGRPSGVRCGCGGTTIRRSWRWSWASLYWANMPRQNRFSCWVFQQLQALPSSF